MHSQKIYNILFSLLTIIMLIVTLNLFLHYRFFCKQVQELLVIKQRYQDYSNELQKKFHNKISLQEDDDIEGILDVDELVEASDDENADEEELSISPFIILNRHPDYLKQSTLEYIQSEELNSVMTSIDMEQWTEYTEQQTVPISKKTNVRSALLPPQIPHPEKKTRAARRCIKNCGFTWPIEKGKFWLSSLFGARRRMNGTWGFHYGIDMAAPKGTQVKSVHKGKVIEARFQEGYGNTVVVQHTDSLKTRYAHMQKIRVYVGQIVKQGTLLGTVGDTGFIRKKGKDGSHLHFEVYENGKRINPLQCLS